MNNQVLEKISSYSGMFSVVYLGNKQGIEGIEIKNATDISMQVENGTPPILLNASEITNFEYRVTGISSEQAAEINAISTTHKIKDRIAKIREFGGKIDYIGMSHVGFKRNLIIVDSNMPQIIGNMLLYFYGEDIKDCGELVKLLGDRDPLDYGDAMIYEYKVKKFLCSCALGMKPEKVWEGWDEANGGHIIVRADGETLAYYIYNRNFFEQYLLDNTILERASTGRHECMSLYEEDGEMRIRLNLQVRFR